MVLNRLSVVAGWVYDNGPLLIGVITLSALIYYTWNKSVKGMLISGAALVASLIWRL